MHNTSRASDFIPTAKLAAKAPLFVEGRSPYEKHFRTVKKCVCSMYIRLVRI